MTGWQIIIVLLCGLAALFILGVIFLIVDNYKVEKHNAAERLRIMNETQAQKQSQLYKQIQQHGVAAQRARQQLHEMEKQKDETPLTLEELERDIEMLPGTKKFYRSVVFHLKAAQDRIDELETELYGTA